MKSFYLSIIFSALIFLTYSCKNSKKNNIGITIATGSMPNMAADKLGNPAIVYGMNDSIMIVSSTDQGRTFSTPQLITKLPELVASAMRGPQIAFVSGGFIIAACNKAGNIFLIKKEENGNWLQAKKLNDVDTVCKEGFISLASEGQNLFCVWLDLRNGHNEIFGARSSDGGVSWSKNILIYASPDKTVCECCKPSVAIKANHVFVMFRNWIKGNRDLYLIESNNSGSDFGQAKKLGDDSWALDGCPMDGGALVINPSGSLQTVWRRKNKIYNCIPGQHEQEIGEGKNCTIEYANGEDVYAWTENGEIIITTAKQKINVGKGSIAIIKSNGNKQVICIWENERKIRAATIDL